MFEDLFSKYHHFTTLQGTFSRQDINYENSCSLEIIFNWQVNISQMSTTPEAKGQSHKASTPSTEDDKSFFADVSAIAPVGEYH